nr:hypothetical protein [Tanacetum cinerariifolium]
MELAHGTRQVSPSAAEDFISNMPDDVITNILDRLRVKDAIRTDAWCRNWRFKWTLLTKLIFDKKFFAKNNFNVKELSKLLFHLKGPITKFALFIDYKILDVEDVNHCVLSLSRKGIKELTINNTLPARLELAANLYSCMELKQLSLFHVCFLHSPTFLGFPNLLSLRLSGTLEIKANGSPDNPHTAVTYSLRLDCNTTRLPQLQNVVLSDIR